jgi:3-hydroxy-9,10-secoandrosta-1,3,5(10)-triene-9,17-dione monooxygenase reductase component
VVTAQGPIDPVAFRRVMGQFATGVTVITVQRGDLMHGMTANTFTSLSLDPPLVLFCVGRTARMATLIDGADGFAINVLAAHQEDVSRHFAGRQMDIGSGVELLQHGPVAPLVPGSLGALSCTIEAMHEGGDHWIVVGRVIALHEYEGASGARPLVFFRSQYAELTPRSTALPVPDVSWSNDAILIYHDEWTMGDDPLPDEYVRAQIWE